MDIVCIVETMVTQARHVKQITCKKVIQYTYHICVKNDFFYNVCASRYKAVQTVLEVIIKI
jgi:hypothetical protein